MAETLRLWILFIFAVTIKSDEIKEWTADIGTDIYVRPGDNALIPCHFKYPSKFSSQIVHVFWKTNDSGRQKENLNKFIFHPSPSEIKDEYRGRTALVGDVTKGECALKITSITKSISGLYLRVTAGGSFSFYKKQVSITVTDTKYTGAVTKQPSASRPKTSPSVVIEIVTPPAATELDPTQRPTSKLHLFISIPIAVIIFVVIASVIAFVLCRKYVRKRSMERKSSDYYVNFSRTTMNQTNSELTQSRREDPKVKVIDDEPVYSNLQPLSHQLSNYMEAEESIYANM